MKFKVVDQNGMSELVDIDLNRFIGRGATAKIYSVNVRGGSFAAKIYDEPNGYLFEKIKGMMSNPPKNTIINIKSKKIVQYAWPIYFLFNSNEKFCGFVMSLISSEEALSLDYFFDRKLSKKVSDLDSLSVTSRIEICRNLAALAKELHELEHLFIDLKPQNIRVYKESRTVAFVDCDGFSICASDGRVFPARLVSTDYIAPEATINRISPSDLGESQDRYALAVLFFQLLNFGTHPFQGVVTDSDAPNTNDEKAAYGLYPYGLKRSSKIAPRPQSVHCCWPTAIRQLFDKSFSNDYTQRPSASDWFKYFDSLLTAPSFDRCEKHPSSKSHKRFNGLNCPECWVAGGHYNQSRNKNSFDPNYRYFPALREYLAESVVLRFLITSLLITFVFYSVVYFVYMSELDHSKNTVDLSDRLCDGNPSNESRILVTEAWQLIDNRKDTPNFSRAYDLNLQAFEMGHAEGASNIGFMWEKGLGVEKNLFKAKEWYNKVLACKFRSAQVELGLSRVYLDISQTESSLLEVEGLIARAKAQAEHPSWESQRSSFLREIAFIERRVEKLKLEIGKSKNDIGTKSSGSSPIAITQFYTSVYTTDGFAAGWAIGEDSRSKARKKAKVNCEEFLRDGETCKEWFVKEGKCLSVARGSNGVFGGGVGYEVTGLESIALDSCRANRGENCEIIVVGCG